MSLSPASAPVHDVGGFQPYIDRLIELAPEQADCIASTPLIVTTGDAQGHGGSYNRATQTVIIARGHDDLPLILGHELAHWLDYSCGFGETHGEEFVAILQGSGVDVADIYRSYDPSRGRPHEIFANVLGSIYAERTVYMEEAGSFVRAWLEG